jgi:hypothetical protein
MAFFFFKRTALALCLATTALSFTPGMSRTQKLATGQRYAACAKAFMHFPGCASPI